MVFDWTFKPSTDQYPSHKIQMFDFRPDVEFSGGIQKTPDETGFVHPVRGGVCVYWLVEDVDKIVGVIEKAGGKILCGIQKEGASGLYRFFEDTEGNMGGVY